MIALAVDMEAIRDDNKDDTSTTDDAYLSTRVEEGLFKILTDFEELASTRTASMCSEKTLEMFSSLDLESAFESQADPVRYYRPLGSHPSACEADEKELDIHLDDPFDDREDVVEEAWMEAAMTDGPLSPEPFDSNAEQLIYAREVKYHRDREFLKKYGWCRVIYPQTGRVVYQHNEGRWPEQPSVKAARRIMRSFFDERRGERRNADVAVKRRRSGASEGKESEVEGCENIAMARVESGSTLKLPAALDGEVRSPSQAQSTELGVSPKRSKTLLGSEGADQSARSDGRVTPSNSETKAAELDEADKHSRRKQKNREAAATSRKRQLDYKRQLEEDNQRLQKENALLRKLLQSYMRGETPLAPGIEMHLDSLIGIGSTLADPAEVEA